MTRVSSSNSRSSGTCGAKAIVAYRVLGRGALIVGLCCACAKSYSSSTDIIPSEPVEQEDANKFTPDASQSRAPNDATMHTTEASADSVTSAIGSTTDMLLIEQDDRVDAVHDAKRQRVYVSTRYGSLVQYDLQERVKVGALDLEGDLGGIDLSPNQDLLLVADRSVDATHNLSQLHIVDLATEVDTPILISTDLGEIGTLTGVFLDDETALITSSYRGSGWNPLRIVHLSDGSVEHLRTVTDTTMLAISPDRSTVGFVQGNFSGGPFGRYNVANGTFQDGFAGGFVYEVGISRDSTQLAVLMQHLALFYDDALNHIGTLGESGNRDVMYAGVVYSPTMDTVYLAATSVDGSSSSVDAFDVRTLEHLAVIDSTHTFDWIGNHPLDSGRLRISRDGRILLATVEGGVVVYWLDTH